MKIRPRSGCTEVMMSDDELLSELKKLGVDYTARAEAWAEVAKMLAAFDAIGRTGPNAMVKIDGERDQDVYTVVLSGGQLAGTFFRKDGSDLRASLREALAFFVAHESKKSARG